MENLERLKHHKRLIDSHFQTLIDEYNDFSDEDVVEEVITMSGILFDMAESFGYNDFIEKVIDGV